MTVGFSPSGRYTTVRISSSEVFLPDELDQIFAVLGQSSTHKLLENIELRLRPESLGLSRDILEYLRDRADEHHAKVGLERSVPRAKRAATAFIEGVDQVLLGGAGEKISQVAEALVPDQGLDDDLGQGDLE